MGPEPPYRLRLDYPESCAVELTGDAGPGEQPLLSAAGTAEGRRTGRSRGTRCARGRADRALLNAFSPHPRRCRTDLGGARALAPGPRGRVCGARLPRTASDAPTDPPAPRGSGGQKPSEAASSRSSRTPLCYWRHGPRRLPGPPALRWRAPGSRRGARVPCLTRLPFRLEGTRRSCRTGPVPDARRTSGIRRCPAPRPSRPQAVRRASKRPRPAGPAPYPGTR